MQSRRAHCAAEISTLFLSVYQVSLLVGLYFHSWSAARTPHAGDRKFRCTRSTPTERMSTRLRCLVCLTNTGVNTPETMLPS